MSDIKEKMLIAVNLERYKEARPQICEVKVGGIKANTIIVNWLTGSYSAPWKPHKIRQGRHMVVLEEEIPKSSVILQNILLTEKRKLKKATIRTLRSLYT